MLFKLKRKDGDPAKAVQAIAPRGLPPLFMRVTKVAGDVLHLHQQVTASGDKSQLVESTFQCTFQQLRGFNPKGKEISENDLRKRIKQGMVVLVAADERLVHPDYLALAREDAIILWGIFVRTPQPLVPE